MNQDILATLTPSQKAKVRRLEKQHEQARHTIQQARYRREEEVRKQAWIDNDCEGRIKAIEAQFLPQIEEHEKQAQQLYDLASRMRKELYEMRTTISAECYTDSYNDAQANAMTAIIKQMNEAHEARIQALLESFKTAEVA